ncbi:MAG: alpha/beta hydrolase, partial [Aeromicrobium sp.]
MTSRLVRVGEVDVGVERRGVATPGRLPMLLLHGGGPGCHAASDLDALAERLDDRELILVDLPGYGLTPLAEGIGPRFTFHAGLLDGLLGLIGVERVDVVAQSLGGSAALRLAATTSRVRRIVLIGSQPVPAPPGTTSRPELGSGARTAYYRSGTGTTPESLRSAVLALEWYDASLMPDALVAARHAASITEHALRAAADPSLLGDSEDLSAVLPEVVAPTLVIWGERDPFADIAYARAWAATLPHGRVEVVPQTAHHPQSERPGLVEALVRSHLQPEEL